MISAENELSKQQTPFDFRSSIYSDSSFSATNQAEADIMTKICSVEGCDRDVVAKGYCNTHYHQILTTGKITHIKIIERNKYSHLTECRVDGCNINRTIRNGYCTRHYVQLRQYGKILERTMRDLNKIILHGDYAEIELYNRKSEPIAYTKIDLEDVDKVKKYKWGSCKGYIGTTGRVYLSRFLMGLDRYKGYGDIEVDHINRNPLDNRKYNLRIVSHAENCNNRCTKKGICKVEWCNKKHSGLGYCTNHYRQFKKYGKIFPKDYKRPVRLCNLPNCNSKHKGLGFCNKHYKQIRIHGEVVS